MNQKISLDAYMSAEMSKYTRSRAKSCYEFSCSEEGKSIIVLRKPRTALDGDISLCVRPNASKKSLKKAVKKLLEFIDDWDLKEIQDV